MCDPTSARYRYEIEPRAPHLGGGWYVQGFENDIEVAQGVFPPDRDTAKVKRWLLGARTAQAGEKPKKGEQDLAIGVAERALEGLFAIG